MSSLQQRLGKNLQVLTQKEEKQKAKQGTIKALEDGAFQEKYTIGEKVMDSTHRHMEIRYATRRADDLKVVVKLRYKPKCFVSKTEEHEWRRSTEFMLNMPRCEGVAQLYEVCEDSKAFYIVTELAKGMDLYELLHSSQKMIPVEAAREVFRKILEGVAHIHEQGAVHKDLKLENIVIDAGNGKVQVPGWSPTSVKIIDFDTVEEWSPESPKARDVLGTDQYIAQEAYDGTYSPSSDIFALGVIFYRLVTGQFPFKDQIFDDQPGENWVGSPKMKQIRHRLKMVKIDWSQECFLTNPALTELCERMLAYSEARRPSAKEALLSEFLGGPGLPKVTQSPVSPVVNMPLSSTLPLSPKRRTFGTFGCEAPTTPTTTSTPSTPARRTLATTGGASLGLATPKSSRPCSSSFSSLPPVKDAMKVS